MRARAALVLALAVAGLVLLPWLVDFDAFSSTGAPRIDGGTLVEPPLHVSSDQSLPALPTGAVRPLEPGLSPAPEAVGGAHQHPFLLRGRVLSTYGEPLGGAQVRLLITGKDEPTTTADATGHWTLELAADPGGLGVMASHPYHASGRRYFAGESSLADAPIDIRLRPVARVRGVVTDMEGAVLAGAGVTIEPAVGANTWNLSEALAVAETDESGAFAVSLGREQAVCVTVRHMGFQSLSPLVRQVSDEPEQFWTLEVPSPGTLVVRLRFDRDVNADVPQEALDDMQVRVGLLGGLARVGRGAPVLGGSARFEGLDRSVPWGAVLAVPGYEQVVLATALTLDMPVTEFDVDMPKLVPSAPKQPAVTPPAPWSLRWEITNPETGGILSGAALLDVITPGFAFAGGVATSLVSGNRESFSLSTGPEYGRGTLLLSVEPPVQLEVEFGGETLVFPNVAASTRIHLPLPALPDVHLVDLRPVDEFGQSLPVGSIELLEAATGGFRTIMATDSGHCLAKLAAGEYYAQVRLAAAFPVSRHVVRVPSIRDDGVIELLVPSAGAIRGRMQWPGPTNGLLEVLVADADAAGWTATPTIQLVRTDGSFEVPTLVPGPKQVAVWSRDAAGLNTLVAEATAQVLPGVVTWVDLMPVPSTQRREVSLVAAPGIKLVWISGPGGAPGFWWMARGLEEHHQLLPGVYESSYREDLHAQDGTGLSMLKRGSFVVEPGEGVQYISLP